jgi:type I restriction enzyme, R subunit
VRALECVIFLRAVRSAVLFEQMKGRGARTLDPEELREVTPGENTHARKTRFILLDAVGVTESDLVDAKPLMAATERQISLENLLKRCGTKAIDETQAAALAGRLARLNQQISPEERDELATVGGVSIVQLARGIVQAIDPDAQEDARLAGGPKAARKLIEDAIAPLTGNPPFRDRIMEIRRDYDIKYDETSKDEVLSLVEVPREERAGSLVTSWHGYLEKHRDEITAIQVLAQRRGGGGRGALAQLKEIAARIRRPPYAWTPVTIWDAYETLDKAAASSGASAGVPDLVSLIRFELGLDADLRPYRSVVEERFAGWLLRQEQAGAQFTVDQMWWLERIRDTVAIGVGIEIADLAEVPFIERGGTVGLVRDFGGKDRARNLINELDRELA